MTNASRVVILGDLLQDVLVELREPLAPSDDARANIRTGAGGSAANVAAHLARLGLETHLVCRVGDDISGRELLGELERDGVTLYATRDDSRTTGRVVVLVNPGGERTMLTDRGASRYLGPEDLPNSLFRSGGHLHLSGYSFFEPAPREAALTAMRLARESGMTLSVDPSSASLLASVGPGRFLEWTGGADLCFPNLEEGTALTGKREPEEVVDRLCEHYVGVVLKLGSGGAMYGVKGRYALRVPTESVGVADTTGAGDAFCAGFVALWLAGESPERALRRGNQLAAGVIGNVGARGGPDQR